MGQYKCWRTTIVRKTTWQIRYSPVHQFVVVQFVATPCWKETLLTWLFSRPHSQVCALLHWFQKHKFNDWMAQKMFGDLMHLEKVWREILERLHKSENLCSTARIYVCSSWNVGKSRWWRLHCQSHSITFPTIEFNCGNWWRVGHSLTL